MNYAQGEKTAYEVGACGDCRRHAALVECDQEHDKYKCTECGHFFIEGCTFEEDFS